MGVIPSSMSVPRLEARIARSQKSGSDESDDMIPYNGTWEQTRKMSRVVAVHRTLFWNVTWEESTVDLSHIHRQKSSLPFSPVL